MPNTNVDIPDIDSNAPIRLGLSGWRSASLINLRVATSETTPISALMKKAICHEIGS